MTTKAMVVLSGGQDSATCAAWARTVFDTMECVSFDYGQRHADKELVAARKVAELFNVPHQVIDVPALGFSDSALTRKDVQLAATSPHTGLPASFVPGRNLVFLTSAAAIAASRGIWDLVTGVCQTDYSGYPDCRQRTIRQLEEAITLGIGTPMRIHTPLMYLTKAETVWLAVRLPKGMDAVALSWTCYEGGQHPCGACPACKLRAKGFAEAGLKDPAL